MKKVLLLIGASIIGISTFAQQNITFYNMRAVEQSFNLNPSRMPDNKLNIGLPGLSNTYVSLSNSAFKYNDILKENGDSTLFDFDALLNSLDEKNFLNFSFQTDLFSIGKRIGKNNYVNFTAAVKGSMNFIYHKDLFELIIKGNGPFIGQTKNLEMAVNSSVYMEYGLGFSREVLKDKLILGTKLKLLSGIAHASTDKTNVTLFTDTTNYALKLTSDVILNTSGDFDEIGDMNPTDFILGKNKGFALDLGATYNLNDKIELGVSILDLGFINWKEDVTNYKSRNPGAVVEFDGVEFDDLFGDSTKFEESLEELVDTLTERFDLVEDSASFRQTLPTQIYLSANYNINKNTNVGFVYYSQIVKNRIIPGFGLSFNRKFGKVVGVYGSYSYYNKSAANIGLGFNLNLGPVQFYTVTDNVLALAGYKNTKNVSVRLAMNLRFGRVDDEKRLKRRKMRKTSPSFDENLNH